MTPSQKCIELIKSHESCELMSYPDPGSDLGKACTARGLKMRNYRIVPSWQKYNGAPWTIGFGHTNGVKQGQVITEQQAIEFLKFDLANAANVVLQLIKVPINQNQFDALTSFVFNAGSGNFQKSTLLRKINSKDFVGAVAEFPKWRFSGGVVMRGLIARRADEAKLFREGMA